MPANDTLDLILKNPDGQPDEVEWARLSPVVAAMEVALGETIRGLVTRRHMLAVPQQEVGKPRALVAARPRQGSLIIPFAFEMVELAPVLARPLMAGLEQPGILNEVLSGLSDAASLVLFARDLLFGERGILARIQRQATAEPPTTRHERAIETAAPAFIEQLTAATIALMEAAERTGCEAVHVRVNDQSEVSLIRSAPRRSVHRLAERGDLHHPVPGPGPGPHLQHVSVTRISDPLRVSYGGEQRLAFISPAPDRAPQGAPAPKRVIIWKSGVEIPAMNERYAAQGLPIDRVELTVEEDIPDSWPRAEQGVFLVDKFRPDPDWS